ncbi:tachykinin-like peptides receptor 99D [Mizuhopecten yessoensis]|uniref:tachykinin-like peptides receptor 99D n=1 Tax=Mizuhopecten yessoensis TaxID=6573 RepID=UPI000B45DB06|nr:tachykinin-like peptides receptor 99D [Mizuhopecten yessoensis]
MIVTAELVYVCVLCVAGLVTVTGNGVLVYLMCSKRSLRNASNFYMASMSIADTGVGLFVTAAIVVTIMDIPLPVGWCYFSPYFELATLSAGIFSFLLISYDRHLAVSKALTYHPTKRSALTSLAAVWVSAFIYSLRIFIQYEVAKILKRDLPPLDGDDDNITETSNDDNEVEGGFCNVLVEEDYNDLIFRCVDFVILFIIPIVCMSYWYKGIISNLWAGNITTTSHVRRKRRVIKLLIINVVVFFVCWIPFYLSDIISDTHVLVMRLKDPEYDEEASSKEIRLCLIFIAISHSYLNPIIFLSFHADFKAELTSTVICKCAWARRTRTVEPTDQTLRTADQADEGLRTIS